MDFFKFINITQTVQMATVSYPCDANGSPTNEQFIWVSCVLCDIGIGITWPINSPFIPNNKVCPKCVDLLKRYDEYHKHY